MSDEIVVDWTQLDGTVRQERVSISETRELWVSHEIVAVSDNITQLTRLATFGPYHCAFTEIPAGVFVLTQLTGLLMYGNRLEGAIPRELGRLRALTQLFLQGNQLTSVPREIGQLRALTHVWLSDNALTSLPSEVGELQSLKEIHLQHNRLSWIPLSMDRWPAWTWVFLEGNPLPTGVGDCVSTARDQLRDVFAATTALAMIRDESTTLAVALQELELPALVTLEIVDAAWENSIPMHKKWDLITTVKHFRQRH